MQLSLQNFQTLVQNAAASVQGSCKRLLNLTPGSVLLAILEAFASIGLWLQYLIVLVWQGCRLSTSSGADVDSFVNDYSLTRLPAAPATGQVTFSRFSAGTAALIVPYFNADGTTNTTNGTQVITADGTQTFGVITDTTNTYWSVNSSGYLIPSGTTSADVGVQAITSGSAANVQAGSISLVATAIPGIDTVTNAAPFLNGSDAESDPALKSRFSNYIQTRARATLAAVEFAITSVRAGLSYSISENKSAAGTYDPGNFVVTIDDGSGSPPSTLLSTVYSAIDAVRPIGSTFSVMAPAVFNVAISMTITVKAGANKNNIIPSVANAVTDYIDTLPIGSSLPYTKLAQLAYGADANITNVNQILLNGAALDVTVPPNGVIKATSVAVN